MKIYTKQGDQGFTSLYDGQRVNKNHWRIQAVGEVDETNCALGLAMVDCKHLALKDLLARLQHQLFDLGADLATPLDSPNAGKVKRMNETDSASFWSGKLMLPPLFCRR